MSTLRLGAYKLPAAEVVLVQTIMRLNAHEEGFHWTFVTSGPYDALLADATTDEGSSPEVDGMARTVLRLTRINGSEAEGFMARPIRADRLQEWLYAAERKLSQSASMPAASAAPASADAPAANISSERYRLKRWPPVVLLQGDSRRIRMATLLSRRALNASELASMSNQPVQSCHIFLQNLKTTGLVEAYRPPPPSAAAAAAPAPAAPRFGRGLIAGIRQRLGL